MPRSAKSRWRRGGGDGLGEGDAVFARSHAHLPGGERSLAAFHLGLGVAGLESVVAEVRLFGSEQFTRAVEFFPCGLQLGAVLKRSLARRAAERHGRTRRSDALRIELRLEDAQARLVVAEIILALAQCGEVLLEAVALHGEGAGPLVMGDGNGRAREFQDRAGGKRDGRAHGRCELADARTLTPRPRLG